VSVFTKLAPLDLAVLTYLSTLQKLKHQGLPHGK